MKIGCEETRHNRYAQTELFLLQNYLKTLFPDNYKQLKFENIKKKENELIKTPENISLAKIESNPLTESLNVVSSFKICTDDNFNRIDIFVKDFSKSTKKYMTSQTSIINGISVLENNENINSSKKSYPTTDKSIDTISINSSEFNFNNKKATLEVFKKSFLAILNRSRCMPLSTPCCTPCCMPC